MVRRRWSGRHSAVRCQADLMYSRASHTTTRPLRKYRERGLPLRTRRHQPRIPAAHHARRSCRRLSSLRLRHPPPVSRPQMPSRRCLVPSRHQRQTIPESARQFDEQRLQSLGRTGPIRELHEPAPALALSGKRVQLVSQALRRAPHRAGSQ